MSSVVIPYEVRLGRDRRWAMREGDMYFDKKNEVFATLERIARRLDALGIPYALVGGMAMFLHGYRRFTEDVDLLVTADSLKVIHEKLDGHGYLPPFSTSKHLRDAGSGVKIEFLVTGGYPGDGLPKPVSFPNPADVSEMIDGIRCLKLPTLIELKLASGLTNPLRGKDIVDVQELIMALNLGTDVAEKLNPFVRDKYLELVRLIRDNPLQPE